MRAKRYGGARFARHLMTWTMQELRRQHADERHVVGVRELRLVTGATAWHLSHSASSPFGSKTPRIA